MEAGACYGEAFGWERPNWFAPPGVEAKYEYSFGRQNWFEYSATEHQAVRTGVGLFDQSSFAKFKVEGKDAVSVLNHICANNIDVSIGRVVYTQWLNERGGIEADLTITRLSVTEFLIIGGAETEVRDFDWLTRHIPDNKFCFATNVTSAFGVISLMGPNSRELLQAMTPSDMSHEAFPFGTSQEIELGYALVRANRLTYVGELGYELYIPTEFVVGVYEAIVAAGEAFDLVHAGYHALNSLRIEKGYRHWGHDITDEDTPLEAGLGFAVRLKKPEGFIGRDRLIVQKSEGTKKQLLQFLLDDPVPMVYHNEPIWCRENLVGYVSSGAYGHTVGASIALGYVETQWLDQVGQKGAFDIEVAGERFSATASLEAVFDPERKKIVC
jgi:4-methylaminobutanoate oxidase (formaldehyde-forming)